VTSHALPSFWKCYEQLPKHIQKLADKSFDLLKKNPRHPSLGFRKKGGVYTAEIGRSYRALARERSVIIIGSGSAHTKIITSLDCDLRRQTAAMNQESRNPGKSWLHGLKA
jgi:hypothetical protein